MTDLLTPIQAALDLPHTAPPMTEVGALPSTFAVTDLAAASIGAAGQAVTQLIQLQTGRLQRQCGPTPRVAVVLLFDSPSGLASATAMGPGGRRLRQYRRLVRLHPMRPITAQRSSRCWGVLPTAPRWRPKSRHGAPLTWNRRSSTPAVVQRRCVRGKPGSSTHKAWR